MKKLTALLLCLLLGLMPMQALATVKNVLVARSEEGPVVDGISSTCVIGDTYYMTDYSGNDLFVHTLGEKEPKVYPLAAQLGELGLDGSQNIRLMTDGEKLMVQVVTLYYSEEAVQAEAGMYEAVIDGDALKLTRMYDLDWEFMRESNGMYYRYLESVIPLKDCALMTTYNEMGEKVFVFMNYADGAMREIIMDGVTTVNPYTENRLLLQMFSYDKPDEIRFAAYDPATDVLEELSKVAVEEYNWFQGLGCNTATGEVYCVKNGEIYPLDIMTGEMGEAVSDMPLEVYSESPAYVTASNYYAFATYDGYVLRCLDKDQPERTTMRICDIAWTDVANKVFYIFTNEHSDVTVINTHDFDAANLIDMMMSRDSTMDIFIMSASYASYEAVCNRGYVAGLGSSEVLSEAAKHFDPAVLERVSVNGEFAVIPMSLYYWLPTINETALAKLGMTMEDVPTNWLDFLDFLIGLQDVMPQDGSLSVFDPWTSTYYAKYQLFDQIFENYQLTLQQDAGSVSRQQMTELLYKLDQIDFARLGQPTEEETMDENFMPEWDNDSFLLSLNGGMSLQGIASSGMGMPMVMALLPSTPAYLPAEATVAFINPYSKNYDLAVEYMETLWSHLNDEVTYSLRTDMTEPTKNSYHEDNVAWWAEYIEELKLQLAEAEPAEVQNLEELLKDATESYEAAKLDIWAISEKDIEWIAQHRSNMVFVGTNWLYNDDDGAAYELVQQYLQGTLSADKFMREIDNKIRMMLMEGY